MQLVVSSVAYRTGLGVLQVFCLVNVITCAVFPILMGVEGSFIGSPIVMVWATWERWLHLFNELVPEVSYSVRY